jgi:hypothetical protein
MLIRENTSGEARFTISPMGHDRLGNRRSSQQFDSAHVYALGDQERNPSMTDTGDTLTISGGSDVFGSDGEKVGSVADIQGDYVVVSKGFFFPTDYYIPTSEIGNVDDDGVHLNLTRDEALNTDWGSVPGTTTVTTPIEEQPIIDAGLHLDNPVPGEAATPDHVDDSHRPIR